MIFSQNYAGSKQKSCKNARNEMLATWEDAKIHTGITSGLNVAVGKSATSLVTKLLLYRYAPHNDVSVNDGPHKQRWLH